MLFNSIDFAIFLPIVFLLYWFLFNKNLKLQNFFIVVASYVFYGWWDWRFLFLIFISTVVDYTVGLGLARQQKQRNRKILLWISLIANLGILGFFKYYNFFADNFQKAFSFFGMEIQTFTLKIILPVGISFYTFQTLSYSIDVYRRKLKPTKDFIAFAAFVSFFPQLVAGPIERATHLLPQFFRPRRFEYDKAVDGMRQILWGLFKKIVIADNAAYFVNKIFSHSSDYSGSTLFFGVVFFAFQIYGDFSGYSDIAIGTARLFGFDLMQNFAFPYFSRDIAEFWRRWHISLSTWFRDYLYIPLGGSRGSTGMKIRNIFAIFVVSGFWHGANWTFIAWGLLNALYFLPLMLLGKNRIHTDVVAQGKWLPTARELLAMCVTFGLTLFAWIFFRADSIAGALNYIEKMFHHPGSFFLLSIYLKYKKMFFLLAIVVVAEWLGREKRHALENIGRSWPRSFRWALYYAIMTSILFFHGRQQEFIYFQF